MARDWASAKKGAISSAVYPAIPQPMGVTRNVSSGWAFAKAMKRSTACLVLARPSIVGNGVGLALEALAVTPLRSEMVQRISGGTSGVVTKVVGAKDKDLPGLQSTDMFWGYSLNHIGSY